MTDPDPRADAAPSPHPPPSPTPPPTVAPPARSPVRVPGTTGGGATGGIGGWFARWARGVIHRALAGLTDGSLVIVDPLGERVFGDPGAAKDPSDAAPRARLTIETLAVYPRLLLHGSLGAGEAYMDGEWRADDLVAVIRLFARNEAALLALDTPWSRLHALGARWAHRARRNTHAGSRANIAAHYDLGNNFYKLWLDETLAYSSGIFDHPGASLADASRAKFDRLCALLGLEPGHRVLEIGCGWGGFAMHAAARYGCHVTAITISEAQHEEAVARVRAAGLTDRVEVRLQDYRDVTGVFDRLVSIEMIEAVGADHLPAFLGICADRLTPDGAMALQAITVPDRIYARALRAVDFLKTYIFPGSDIPSVAALLEMLKRRGDLALVHLEEIGAHYAWTLRAWRERFLARRAEVLALPRMDERFLRMWEFYLAYCEGSFQERWNGDVQMLLVKPKWRDPRGPAGAGRSPSSPPPPWPGPASRG